MDSPPRPPPPYTFVVMSLMIVILGILATFRMPTDIFPEIDVPVVSVIWSYAGISRTSTHRSWREHYAGVYDPDDGLPAKVGTHGDKGPVAGTKPPLLVRFEAHEKRVNSVLFFPDGTRLLSCGIDGKLQVWETGGRLLVGLRAAGPIESVALSPDGSLLACSASNAVDLWDLRNGRRVASYHGHKLGVYTVGFHPAGRHVISSYEETLRIWDIGTGREVHRISCCDDLFMAVAFSPDYRFAAVSGDRGTVRCIDLRAGNEWCSLAGHSSLVTSVAVSRDGRFLLTGSLI